MPNVSSIDRLTWSDEQAAVASLSAAFADYPLFPVLCPNPKRRPGVVEAFCRVLFRMSVRCDGVYATADRSAVVCVWPPGSEWPSSWTILRPGGLSLLWRLDLRGSWMLGRLERGFDAARITRVPGPHWYVPLLGVRPDAQGRGLSRAVLQPVFEAADRDRLPIYLETVPEVNVAIYQKLDFELRGHRELAGGLANWELVRMPASKPASTTTLAEQHSSS